MAATAGTRTPIAIWSAARSPRIIGRGDVTSAATIDAGQRARGVIVAKATLVVAGLDVAAETFRAGRSASVFEVRWATAPCASPARSWPMVTGDARALLDRRAHGAQLPAAPERHCDADARSSSMPPRGRIMVLDTRKTTPGFRALEKYAVRCGGGTNHRQRLDDGMLIKDNHKRLAGGVARAAARAMQTARGLPVEVEVETLDELDEALAAGAPRILLDNFTTYDIREAVERVARPAEIEISGGVTLERIPELAATGAQFVSVGALTHSAPRRRPQFRARA